MDPAQKVLRIGNPKRRWSAIARTDAQSLLLGLGPQIVLENIVGLNSVLCDETVPERIVRHVVLNENGVGSVDDDASLEGVSDDVVFHDASYLPIVTCCPTFRISIPSNLCAT